MKFIHVGGDIADFDGYTFMFKNPVDVPNQYTIDRLMKNPRFKVAESKESKVTETKVETVGKSCPKCGRVFQKGIYIHVKYCKG